MKILNFTATALLVCALVACNGVGDTRQVIQPTAQRHLSDTLANLQAQALPQAITDFLQQHFPGANVAYVESDNKNGLKYDVTLNDGTEIDFDLANQWEEVDCKIKPVPPALVPPAIDNYVKTLSQKDLMIIKIGRKHYGYEIELSNGLDMRFNLNGQFIGVDD